jgi:hypothetical protein
LKSTFGVIATMVAVQDAVTSTTKRKVPDSVTSLVGNMAIMVVQRGFCISKPNNIHNKQNLATQGVEVYYKNTPNCFKPQVLTTWLQWCSFGLI